MGSAFAEEPPREPVAHGEPEQTAGSGPVPGPEIDADAAAAAAEPQWKPWAVRGVLAVALAFGLYAAAVLASAWGMAAVRVADWGVLGDAFGVLNALFSGLAFVAVAVAILLQRHELKMQREELELQRAEMARTREELEGSRRAHQETVELMLLELELQTRVALLGAPELIPVLQRDGMLGAMQERSRLKKPFEGIAGILKAIEARRGGAS
jgi:uncharacterized membrane protein